MPCTMYLSTQKQLPLFGMYLWLTWCINYTEMGVGKTIPNWKRSKMYEEVWAEVCCIGTWCTHACRMEARRGTPGISLWSSPSCFLDSVAPCTLSSPLAKLTGQQVPRIHLSLSPDLGLQDLLGFYVGAGNLTWVPLTDYQAFLTISESFSHTLESSI